MNVLIESVARALCRKACEHPDTPNGKVWQNYEDHARSAIEALSNLPREMAELFAEAYANGDPNDQIAPTGVIDAWRDTVAGILK